MLHVMRYLQNTQHMNALHRLADININCQKRIYIWIIAYFFHLHQCKIYRIFTFMSISEDIPDLSALRKARFMHSSRPFDDAPSDPLFGCTWRSVKYCEFYSLTTECFSGPRDDDGGRRVLCFITLSQFSYGETSAQQKPGLENAGWVSGLAKLLGSLYLSVSF